MLLKLTFTESVTKEQAFCADVFQNVISDEAGYAEWKQENADRFIR